LKNVTGDPSPDPKKQIGTGPKKQFIVIEIPAKDGDHSYPKAIFACDTVEEALKLCRQMNADAGSERYGIQRPATPTQKAP
jgi:hypothetical protein